jgi:hypothetical protein
MSEHDVSIFCAQETDIERMEFLCLVLTIIGICLLDISDILISIDHLTDGVQQPIPHHDTFLSVL